MYTNIQISKFFLILAPFSADYFKIVFRCMCHV